MADKIDNTQLVNDFRARGGRVVHCRATYETDRAVTVTYIDHGNRMEISTAVQHSADDFTKKVGTKLAIERFNEGKTVVLPRKRSSKPSQALRDMAYWVQL